MGLEIKALDRVTKSSPNLTTKRKKKEKKGMMAVGGEPPTAFKQFPDP